VLIGPGFWGKPLLEKAKIVLVFGLIGLTVSLSRPRVELYWPGLTLVMLGTSLRIWAAGHLTRDQRLTTSGPYQHLRHPFYLGRLFILIGFALMSGLQNPLVWAVCGAGLIFFFAGYLPRKERRENGRLERLFGDEFKTWRANVPGLWPRWKPFVTERRPWNWKLFLSGDGRYPGNKELPAVLAFLVLSGLFYWRLLVSH